MQRRVLIVDDFEPFRRYLCSRLELAEFLIVGEASDGLEAVEKAEKLQPDLIILDLGLQKMNGLEAARQIRKLAPEAKILCLSQEFCSDLTEAALQSGALGYIHKMRAGSELLRGIQAVLQGRCFLSGGVVATPDI